MKNQKGAYSVFKLESPSKVRLLMLEMLLKLIILDLEKKEHCEQLYRLNNNNNGYDDNSSNINKNITF